MPRISLSSIIPNRHSIVHKCRYLPELGKVSPYGVYVLNDNTVFVNLGTDHDTSEFAAESICRWWFIVGKNTFPNAKRIFITADGGGSNRPRGLQWKYQLKQIADITGLEIHMSHFPPVQNSLLWSTEFGPSDSFFCLRRYVDSEGTERISRAERAGKPTPHFSLSLIFPHIPTVKLKPVCTPDESLHARIRVRVVTKQVIP